MGGGTANRARLRRCGPSCAPRPGGAGPAKRGESVSLDSNGFPRKPMLKGSEPLDFKANSYRVGFENLWQIVYKHLPCKCLGRKARLSPWGHRSPRMSQSKMSYTMWQRRGQHTDCGASVMARAIQTAKHHRQRLGQTPASVFSTEILSLYRALSCTKYRATKFC